MWTRDEIAGVHLWGVIADGVGYGPHLGEGGQAEARGAAWIWYDHRLALAAALEARVDAAYSGARTDHGETWWPRCLTWSDEQVAAAERWLAEGGEMPEVLRG